MYKQKVAVFKYINSILFGRSLRCLSSVDRINFRVSVRNCYLQWIELIYVREKLLYSVDSTGIVVVFCRESKKHYRVSVIYLKKRNLPEPHVH